MSKDINQDNSINQPIDHKGNTFNSEYTSQMESDSSSKMPYPSSSNESNDSLHKSASAFRSKVMGSEYFVSLIEGTQENDIQKVRYILEQNKNIDIKKCSDSKGYNLIHKCILNNQTELVNMYIEYGKQYEARYCQTQEEVQTNIKNWVNQQTKDDQFTPLHLASFRGLIEIMQCLDENGADYNITNIKGTNVVHFAAQGDQPKALVYLKSKKLDQNVRDDKLGTPLHWASFLGHENSVNYLLSWNVELDNQDNDGLTPLHLATLMGFSRIVKKLLIRGAQRDIEDAHQKTAFQIADEKNYVNIKQMIDTSGCSIQEYCNIKPAFKKTTYPWRQVVLFMIMYWVGIFIFVVFDFPFFNKEEQWCVFLCLASIFITILFFLIVWLKDSGQLKAPKKKRTEKELLKLLRHYDSSKICPDCFILKSERSRHCETCQSCVMVYDHHCPWINNCVGAKNHFYFYCFIISMWINLAILIVFICLHLGESYQKLQEEGGNHFFPWFNHDRPPSWLKDLCLITNLTVAGLFELPLTLLIIIHTNNLLMNKSTFERFNQHHLQQSSQDSISQDLENGDITQSNITQSLLSNGQQSMNNPRQSQNEPAKFDRSCGNCLQMCFKNKQVEDFGYQDSDTAISQESNQGLLDKDVIQQDEFNVKLEQK